MAGSYSLMSDFLDESTALAGIHGVCAFASHMPNHPHRLKSLKNNGLIEIDPQTRM